MQHVQHNYANLWHQRLTAADSLLGDDVVVVGAAAVVPGGPPQLKDLALVCLVPGMRGQYVGLLALETGKQTPRRHTTSTRRVRLSIHPRHSNVPFQVKGDDAGGVIRVHCTPRCFHLVLRHASACVRST